MSRFVLAALAVLFANSAFAQDEIFFRSKEKSFKGVIKTESPKGIDVTGLKETVPFDDVLDVLYEVTPVDVRIGVYRPALASEKDYADPDPKKEAKRKANLGDALKKYTEAHGKIKEKSAKRHLEYKIAVLTTRAAQDEGGDVSAGIKKLETFKTLHPSTWQIVPAMQLLAQLYQDTNQGKQAEATYLELAALDGVPDEVKQEATLSAFQASTRSGKLDLAKLQKFAASLPKDSRFRLKAKIVEAEGLMATKKTAEAVTMLRQVTKETSDKALKAAAYNALGTGFYQAEQLKEARWEFLWVDVVYNQDKHEHAKALYYLSQIFDKLGEPERAQECRETLISDRAFTGLPWQRLAQKGAK